MVLETLTTLSSIKQQQQVLEAKKRDLTTPMLSDLSLIPSLYDHDEMCLWLIPVLHLSLIPSLYDWFVEYITPMELRPSEITRRRKQFVLIVLFLYAPSALNGGRLCRGIRGTLARLFRMKTPSAISNMAADLAWQYQQYADFREETDKLFDYLKKHIGTKIP